ncbi:hypothetical protein [Bradyrhizobium sp. cf659]|uniref:hypothetical protein n=1 Tax=Bradyrhizobium sp. cf659 TaxID=1761771 RepID=UPI0011600B1E|nr:hypothetical protein [Bradyrhizobium sp. cf659]
MFADQGYLEPPDEKALTVVEQSDKLPPLRDAIVCRYMPLVQGKIGAYSLVEVLSRHHVSPARRLVRGSHPG